MPRSFGIFGRVVPQGATADAAPSPAQPRSRSTPPDETTAASADEVLEADLLGLGCDKA